MSNPIMLRYPWKVSPRKQLYVSYLKDWIIVIVMAAIFFAIDALPPFHREFSLEDKTIMYPYAETERVPMWLCGVVAFACPIVIMAIISLGIRRSVLDFHNSLLGLCLGLSITVMLMDVVKITAGRPRPDLLDRCQPQPGSVDPPLGLSNYTICTTDPNSYIMRDGFKSFPSGHASISFSGLGFLSLYLAGKMRIFDERGHTYKAFVAAFPLLGALLIAITRTEDYRHHWQDVTVGAILGWLTAYFAYRQYYPSLAKLDCQVPFSPRIRVDSDIEAPSDQLPSHQLPSHQLPSMYESADDDRLHDLNHRRYHNSDEAPLNL